MSEDDKQKREEEKKDELKKVQAVAEEKQKRRTELMGELLRSKGFFWLATSNDVIGGWQQAGNVLRSGDESVYLCIFIEPCVAGLSRRTPGCVWFRTAGRGLPPSLW